MDLNINWNFLGGISLVGAGPIFLYRKKIKLYFDSKIFEISDILNLFVSVSSICVYICLATTESTIKLNFSGIPWKYLLLSASSGFIYLLVGILFSNVFNKDIVVKKNEELESLKYFMSLEKEASADIRKKAAVLSFYFFKLKLLLIFSVVFYWSFFLFLSIALIKAGFY